MDNLLDSAAELVAETADEVGSAPDSSTPTRSSAPRTNATGQQGSDDLTRILGLRVPLMVILAERTMNFRDVLRLTAGSIIEFDRSSESDLQLVVGNQAIGSGQAVKVGENFGLHVSKIGSLTERVKAMGGH